jgi:hypothetical protein
MLSFLFFIKFAKHNTKSNYLTSFLFFLLALASSEFTLVIPVLCAVYIYLSSKKKKYTYLAPYISINLIYLFFRFIVFPLPARDDYSLSFNHLLVNNFLWYGLWSIGIPESFKSLIFPSLPQQSIKILAQFWQITLPFLLLAPILCVKILLWAKQDKKNLLFLSSWYFIGLLPVIFLTGHSYPVYLSLASFGILSMISLSIKNSKFTLALVVFFWTVLSYTSINFTKNTHWIRNEQAISKAYAAYSKEKVPEPPSYSTFIFKPANLAFSKSHDFHIVEGENTLKLSLSDQSAMQVIYNDPTIKSIFLTHQEAYQTKQNGPVFEIYPQK